MADHYGINYESLACLKFGEFGELKKFAITFTHQLATYIAHYWLCGKFAKVSSANLLCKLIRQLKSHTKLSLFTVQVRYYHRLCFVYVQ